MNHPRIAQLLFNRPLLVGERRLQTILNALMPYFDGEAAKKQPISLQHGDQGIVSDNGIQGEVAVIPILGTLVNRSYGLEAMSGGPTSYFEIREQVASAARNPAVKGIVLDIDSGGGEANGVFDLADFIRSVAEEKKVLAMVDEAAFSGAYALASGAERIVVPRTGGVGSIGVVALHVDQSGFNKMAGLKYTFIQAGAQKTEGNPHEPLSSEAFQHIQEEVNHVYELFIQTVAKHRALSAAEIRGTEAALFFGNEAVKAKLADEVLSRQDALGQFTETIAKGPMFSVGTSWHLLREENTMSKKTETEQPQPSGSPDPETQPEAVAPPSQAAPEQKPKEEPEASETEKAVAAYHAYCNDVLEVCQLAGKMSLAKDFISKKTSVEQVRSALLEQRVQEDEALSVVGTHEVPKEKQTSASKVEPVASVFSRWQSEMNGKNA